LPYKDPQVRAAKQKIYARRHYEQNREKTIKRSVESKRVLRAKWAAYKASLHCERCGIQHEAVIDFHHVDRSPPKRNVNALVTAGSYKKVFEEIKKCIALCSNCHRILHHDERKLKRRKHKLKHKRKKS
jgi:predicted HNH restriction endonuclease